MNPPNSPVLDEDFTGWAADLRGRVDAVDVQVPDLDDVLAEAADGATRATRATRVARPSGRVLAGIAAAVLLLVGATVVLAGRDGPSEIRTRPDRTPDRRSDPLDGAVLLGPPADTVSGVQLGPDPQVLDSDEYRGDIRNWIGGQVGSPVRLLTLLTSPTGSTNPPFAGIAAGFIQLGDWFADGLVGTPVGATIVPIDILGAEVAFDVTLAGRLGDEDHRLDLIVAQGNGQDVVLAGTGIAPDELRSLAPLLSITTDGASMVSPPLGLEPVGGNGARRSSTLYTVTGAAETVFGTRLADAAPAIAALHRVDVLDSTSDSPTVERGGPDWALSYRTTAADGDVLGIRDGMWIRIMQNSRAEPPASPLDRLAALVRYDRAEFNRLQAATPPDSGPGVTDLERVVPLVDGLGSWVPTWLPDGAQVRSVASTMHSPQHAVPGLPMLWRPDTGATAHFVPDPLPLGIRLDEKLVGRLRGDIYRPTTGSYLAEVVDPTVAGSPSIGIRTQGLDLEQLTEVFGALERGDDGVWSMPVPPVGYEAVAGTDTEQEQPTEPDGYGLVFGRTMLWISPGTGAQKASNLANFLQAVAVERSTVDGRTVYAGYDEQLGWASVFVPGDGDRPDVFVDEAPWSLDDTIALALSVRSVDKRAVREFLAPLSTSRDR